MSQNVATIEQTSWVNFIQRAASDPAYDVVKLEALLRMQREVAHEQARREFNQAMAAAQAEMMPVIRDAQNTHTGSKYAKLETIDAAMRPIYTRHGFSIRFGTAPPPRNGWIRVMCTVAHSGGYEEPPIALDSPLDVAGSQGKTNKTGIQAVGSSVSYLRRYLLTMAFNIVLADDDDDGEAQRGTAGNGRDRQAARGYPPQGGSSAPSGAAADPLEERHGDTWLKNLDRLLDAASTLDEVNRIGGHPRVLAALNEAPTLIRSQIRDTLAAAYARLAPTGAGEDAPLDEAASGHPEPEVEAMLAEIAGYDLITIEQSLSTSAAWRARVNALLPMDQDVINEAVEARRTALKAQRSTPA